MSNEQPDDEEATVTQALADMEAGIDDPRTRQALLDMIDLKHGPVIVNLSQHEDGNPLVAIIMARDMPVAVARAVAIQLAAVANGVMASADQADTSQNA